MSDEKSYTGNISLNIIPDLHDDGSNWFDFERRVEECLTMCSLASTIKPICEPLCPAPIFDLADGASEASVDNHQQAVARYAELKNAYDRAIQAWEEKQGKACMAIRSKCGYNNFQKIKAEKRAYKMLAILRSGRSTGAGKLIELTTRFYGLTLADCKSVADFSGSLSQINNELQNLHQSTAFTTVQLTLRFLQGLGSAYEVFITTFQQTHNLFETPGQPAVSFETTVQKAYDEETRQSSSTTGAGAALAAVTGTTEFCDYCHKPRHNAAKCWKKYPHLKKEHERRKASKKRNRDDSGSSGNRGFKKQRSDNSTPATESGETTDDTGAVMVTCLAMDLGVETSMQHAEDTDTAFFAPIRALQNVWVVDTGCTNHATGTLSHFKDITRGNYGVCGGIGGSVAFEGIGTVHIPIPGANGKDTTLVLTDVKYCPQMGAFNLISVSQLFKKGLRPSITQDAITWPVGKHKVKASARNGLWLLDRP